MPRPRLSSRMVRSRDGTSEGPALTAEGFAIRNFARENVLSTTNVPSVVREDNASVGAPGGDSPPTAPSAPLAPTAPAAPSTSVSVILQIVFGVLFVICIITVVLWRRRSRKRNARDRIKVRHLSQIGPPNGLAPGPAGKLPPTYQEALQSPVFTESKVSARGHQRHVSEAELLDQCWAAVYETEHGAPHHDAGSPRSSTGAAAPAATPAGPGPASPPPPLPAAQPAQRRSVVLQWFHSSSSSSSSQRARRLSGASSGSDSGSDSGFGSGSGSGPLSAHPPSQPASPFPPPLSPPPSAALPALPSPSYSSGGRPSPPRAIRASIPHSVLYPPPLQPAPPRRRRLGEAPPAPPEGRESNGSIMDLYGAAPWRTPTPLPHKDVAE